MRIFGLSSIILLMLFFSCNVSDDCVKVNLSQEDLQWTDSYKVEDTVIFECKTNQLRDSFVVIQSGNYFTECNKFEFGNYQYNFAKIGLRPIKFGKIIQHASGIQLEFSNDSQSDKNELSMKSFLVFDLSVDFKDLKKINQDSVTIGKKSYSAYHFDSEKGICNDLDGNSFDVKSFYWNKKVGLVRYVKGTGEVFDLLVK